MARIKVRYFTERSGALKPDGTRAMRYFWQPSKALEAAGFALKRLDDNRAIALQEAEAENAKLDRWRAGQKDAVPAEGKGTLAALIVDYRKSDEYRELKPKTRVGYEWALRVIGEWGGDVAVPLISRKRCKVFHNAMKETAPAKARLVFAVLRLVMEHGVREEWIESNPAAGHRFKRVKAKKGLLWSREAIEAFVALADAVGFHSIGTAVLLNEWLGQREGDLIELPRAAWQSGRGIVDVSQSKTGADVLLPLAMVPHLVARIEAELVNRERTIARHGGTILPVTLLVCETTGRAWTESYFQHTLKDIRTLLTADADERDWPGEDAAERLAAIRQRLHNRPDLIAELAELVFKWLRHTAVTRLAEANVDLPGIASITGHSLRRVAEILDIYLVRTGKLARMAFAKRIEAERSGT